VTLIGAVLLLIFFKLKKFKSVNDKPGMQAVLFALFGIIFMILAIKIIPPELKGNPTNFLEDGKVYTKLFQNDAGNYTYLVLKGPDKNLKLYKVLKEKLRNMSKKIARVLPKKFKVRNGIIFFIREINPFRQETEGLEVYYILPIK
jgi:hypothetical protein